VSDLLRPFPARLVKPEWATRVVSPAYDGMNAEARRELMEDNPHVFLHVTRSPEDAEAGIDLDELTSGNAQALERILDAGAYEPMAEPAIYLYRLELDGHIQSGIVADVAVDAYADGRLRRHEHTHDGRENVLASHLSRVGVASSPVAVTYRASADIDRLVAEVEQQTPHLQFTDDGGLMQSVWRIDDPVGESALEAAFDEVPLYITDGHHRTAAALRLRNQRREAGLPVGDFDRVLCVLFPDDQLRVFEFNRRVAVGEGPALQAAMDRLAGVVELRPAESPEAAKPAAPRQFAAYADGSWSTFEMADPDAMDASLLHDRIIDPLLEGDSGSSARVEYVPGTAGLDELEARCDRFGGIGLAMYPEPVADLMKVADAGGVLPPKSTFFHPKARTGIFLRFRDGEHSG
jgi:uncharacterized protein (DUF1015 family)